MGPERGAQGGGVGVLDRHPVARQMIGGDGVERQIDHHPAAVARPAQGVGELVERRGTGGVGGDAGDRRGGGEPGEAGGAGMFRVRNIRAVPRDQCRGRGQAAAGHQAVSSAGSRTAASSSRRQEASSSRLKPA